MKYFLYSISVVLYPIVFLLNGKIFYFAVFSPHISLIFLPAFLRLFNVLVFGSLRGSVVTFLGGAMLFPFFDEDPLTMISNDLCSSLSPVAALFIFQIMQKRHVRLNLLKDLLKITLIYSLCNALIHHLYWAFAQTDWLSQKEQFFQMFIGDLIGTILGVLILKAIVDIPFVNKKIYNAEV